MEKEINECQLQIVIKQNQPLYSTPHNLYPQFMDTLRRNISVERVPIYLGYHYPQQIRVMIDNILLYLKLATNNRESYAK
jgi:hypothetical protein